MSDSEDELNTDISHWKLRTANTAPRPVHPPPRTFAAINAPEPVSRPSQQAIDEDEDIDAIIAELDAPAPEPSAPSQDTRKTVQVVITPDPAFDRGAYEDCTYGSDIVRRVLQEFTQHEDVFYKVEFVDRHAEQVSPSSRLRAHPSLLAFEQASIVDASVT